MSRPKRIFLSPSLADFELCALHDAHLKAAEECKRWAALHRERAGERGPIWQRYLGTAIRLERQARQHIERARDLLSFRRSNKSS